MTLNISIFVFPIYSPMLGTILVEYIKLLLHQISLQDWGATRATKYPLAGQFWPRARVWKPLPTINEEQYIFRRKMT